MFRPGETDREWPVSTTVAFKFGDQESRVPTRFEVAAISESTPKNQHASGDLSEGESEMRLKEAQPRQIRCHGNRDADPNALQRVGRREILRETAHIVRAARMRGVMISRGPVCPVNVAICCRAAFSS